MGNGASYDIQMDAGVDKADLMIAVTNADEVNLLCCLIAKKAGGCQTIARVRNPVYHHEIHHIKDELGLSMVINPEWAAAMEMARLLRFPSAIDIDTFANGRIELLRFQLDDKNPLCGHKIRDLDTLSKCEVLVCIVERGNEVRIPGGEFVLENGDMISVVASPLNASRFFRTIGIETNQVRNTMIIGGGKISFYLAKRLLEMGIQVKIVEKDRAACERLCEQLPEGYDYQRRWNGSGSSGRRRVGQCRRICSFDQYGRGKCHAVPLCKEHEQGKKDYKDQSKYI